jgi:hemolysin D
VWATVGKIDIIAVAKGKTVPSGYSKVIQPLEAGLIAAIYVKDGQVVKEGQTLIDLDPTAAGAEEERAVNEYQAAKLEADRLRALVDGTPAATPMIHATSALVAVKQRLLQHQTAEQRAKLEAAQRQIEQRQASVQGIEADIRGLEQILPLLTKQAEAYKSLLAQQYIAEMQYLQAEQQRLEREKELSAKKESLRQERAALAEANANYKGLLAEYRRAALADLADTETKAASLAQDVVKAGQRHEQQRLVSPIGGIVQQLAVHTVGGVVTPAQQLMVVVPAEHQLEVEAWLENKDIGFVHAGQPVEVKVESFPFTVYGTIPGMVVSVSQDAVPQENGDLLFSARVALSRTSIAIAGRDVRLSPGMAVTAEIATGQRRLIEFFLSPIFKGLAETAHER